MVINYIKKIAEKWDLVIENDNLGNGTRKSFLRRWNIEEIQIKWKNKPCEYTCD